MVITVTVQGVAYLSAKVNWNDLQPNCDLKEVNPILKNKIKNGRMEY